MSSGEVPDTTAHICHHCRGVSSLPLLSAADVFASHVSIAHKGALLPAPLDLSLLPWGPAS